MPFNRTKISSNLVFIDDIHIKNRSTFLLDCQLTLTSRHYEFYDVDQNMANII